ncbi:MAG TPA: dienelactone hydrolase family protein [Thiobacillaceae bacterium]|nr:dienelactone hydrolase family protein [Thiobacillaceae bacterium]HNF89419.1 dienelactone hydrolase family protein [Thiobacillaceae bacterium]HNH89302.1 dienelactone hydrolase family protein [Thiobacillaceae bacterium]
MRYPVLFFLLLLPVLGLAGEVRQITLRSGDVDVPVEVAIPDGPGPFPPVLFIHAKRGYDDNERRHVAELAKQGFLVVAPDWQSGRMIERWPAEHDPATEKDVEAALDYLLALPQTCKQPVGIVALSRGPYYAIRLADKRGKDIAAIVSYYGHMQNPNAPEPDQLFRVAPEVMRINTPMLFLIGEQDFELRRINGGRAFYALWERGVPVEYQVYPLARRAFDFRADQTPEEQIATRHARQRAEEWLKRWMKTGPACR